jgi:hypothetical protein
MKKGASTFRPWTPHNKPALENSGREFVGKVHVDHVIGGRNTREVGAFSYLGVPAKSVLEAEPIDGPSPIHGRKRSKVANLSNVTRSFWGRVDTPSAWKSAAVAKPSSNPRPA